MAIVKTAISIQESLFERADALAEQREAIDSALQGEPDPGEKERVRLMRQKQRRLVKGQW
jgi:hypothetical protein